MTKGRPPTTPEVSARMKRVGTSRTGAELKVEKILRKLKIRYRRNVKSLPGTPDFFLVEHQIAVFVDGCFWHGCPRCFSGTTRNREWWDEKVLNNRRRDRRCDAAIRRRGISVLHLWEHDDSTRCSMRIQKAIETRKS